MTVRQGAVRSFQTYALGLNAAMIAALIGLSLRRTGGEIVYTLDDPYIHLALAQSILEGGYGINPGEYASPSSSILYPFLLALGLGAGVPAELAPLCLAVPFALAATWCLAGFAWARMAGDDGAPSPVIAAVLAPLLVIATNAAALPLTGMEHSLHVFATVLTLTGLYALSGAPESRTALGAVMAGILLCATIRFEGLALAAAGLAALVALGHRRAALGTGALVALLLAAYGLLMQALGLPLFPSSVMTKSAIAAEAGGGSWLGAAARLATNLPQALANRWGVLFGVAATALVAAALTGTAAMRGRMAFLLAAAFVLAAHLAAGQYGWFSRYEVYAVAAMITGLFALAPFLPLATRSLVAALLLMLIGVPYALTTRDVPKASANIHQQQFQMHRFAQGFMPARVAVNDLGYVALGNPNYVLDLWGLGSEEARKLSANNRWTPAALDRITRRRRIAYAMIYKDWFGEVPARWCHAADLVTSQVTSAGDTVSFYLIDRTREDEMRAALARFGKALPEGAGLRVFACPSAL